jgi:hypothetical protein
MTESQQIFAHEGLNTWKAPSNGPALPKVPNSGSNRLAAEPYLGG